MQYSNENILNENYNLKKSWIIALVASLHFFYCYFQLSILNTINLDIMRDFSINAYQVGKLSSLYFYSNCIFALPAGLLLDKFSPKKLILISMAIAILSMFGFALSHSFMLSSINRFLSGISGAFSFVSGLCLISKIFPPKKMAFAVGVSMMIGMTGGMVAQAPVALLTEAIGWRNALVVSGFLGIIVLAIIFMFVEDPKKEVKPLLSEDTQKASLVKIAKIILCNKYNWINATYAACLNTPIFLLGALWGGTYLTQAKHLTLNEASLVTTMIFFGIMIGAPTVGYISDLLDKRREVMIANCIVGLIAIFILIYCAKLSVISLLILFFVIGFIASSNCLSYPVALKINPPFVAATVGSLISVFLTISGFVFQPLFGWLMNLNWNHLIVNNTPVYSASDFKWAMFIIPFVLVLGVISAVFIRENLNKNNVN